MFQPQNKHPLCDRLDVLNTGLPSTIKNNTSEGYRIDDAIYLVKNNQHSKHYGQHNENLLNMARQFAGSYSSYEAAAKHHENEAENLEKSAEKYDSKSGTASGLRTRATRHINQAQTLRNAIVLMNRIALEIR